MRHEDTSKLEVGFKDVASFGVGVLVPLEMLTAALIVALAVSLGRSAGPALSLAFTLGIVLAIGLEIVRRRVLVTRPEGGRHAVRLLRGVIWLVVLGVVPITAFVAIGVMTRCYGQSCDELARVLMVFMLVLCVLCLIAVPLGYRLLSRAAWLQPR